MSAHCTVQQLSSYVDEELAPPELRLVESHLSECSECRDRLSGLGHVVRELGRVERAAPPPELGYRVERAVELAPGPARLWQRGEAGARRWIDPPTVGPLFGVVLALAVIFYLAAVYNEKSQQRRQAAGTTTRLVITPSGAESDSRDADPVASDRSSAEELVQWRGRSFRRHGAGWWEEGIPAQAEPRAVSLAELAEALGVTEPLVPDPLSGTVRMRIGERAGAGGGEVVEVVEVVFPD